MDVGCGDGRLTALHSSSVGLDNGSEVALRGCSIPVVQGDMSQLPFKNSVFDTVVYNHSLEHTPNPAAVLDEASRVLREGGRLIVASPNARYFLWPLYWARKGYMYGPEHKSLFTFSALKSLITGADFVVTDTFSTHLYIDDSHTSSLRFFRRLPGLVAFVEAIGNMLSRLHPLFSYDVGVIAQKRIAHSGKR